LFTPAAEGTRLRAFENVFADIGDEQSIEQSLSTFSSHMKNIVGILEEADDRSLVLLDELGAGTDPVEGAALAMSILEELHARGCITAATTHYSEIKAFALTRSGMENASMEFDVDRLCPTYRLFVGIPGKSNAFEIAGRLGLSEGIIESARGFLKREDVQFEDVIQSAQDQKLRAEQEKLQAQELRYELQRLHAQVEQEKKRLESEKASLRAKAKEEARAIVRSAREEMEQAIVGLRSIKNVDMRQVERAIQHARDIARRQDEALADPLAQAERDGKAPENVRPGDRVRVLNIGQNATVLKPADARGEVQVQAGVIKLMARLSDLRLIEDPVKPSASGGKLTLDPAHTVAGLALDVRGRMVDEALMEVDRYLDDAVLNGRQEVQIINGKGTGALRKGIQDYLRRHSKVKDFRLGNYGEGDAGVTIVTLK
jgi:DNA mismatch repair protein MutS2